ncbi:MAG: Hpt domain-containing protein [Desulfamplus sp.]|nr:Hpt domain-containing protein [Desulfamplus sp.]
MDFKEMASNIGLEEEDFIELLEMLVEVSFKDIDNFEKEFAAQNYSGAAMAAHSIKGASGNLGLTEISDTAAELEQAAKLTDDSQIPEKIGFLKKEMDNISEALKDYRPRS